jgi:hypothetical protein
MLFSIARPSAAMQSRFPDYYMCILNYELMVTVKDGGGTVVSTGGRVGLPPAHNLTILAWKQLVDEVFAATPMTVEGNPDVATVADVLEYDWDPTEFAIPYVSPEYRPDVRIKAVRTSLASKLSGEGNHVSVTGPWALLQYFGKPMTAMAGTTPGINLQSLMVVFSNTEPAIMEGVIDVPSAGPYLGYIDGFMNDS